MRVVENFKANPIERLLYMTLVVMVIGAVVAILVLANLLQDNNALIQKQQQIIDQIKTSTIQLEDQATENTSYLKCLLAIDTHQPDAAAPCSPPSLTSSTPLPQAATPTPTPTPVPQASQPSNSNGNGTGGSKGPVQTFINTLTGILKGIKL